MVLENATTAAGGYHEDAPPSDQDRYSDHGIANEVQAGQSSDSRRVTVEIDTAGFPRPMPVVGAIVGYNKNFFLSILASRELASRQRLGRYLEKDEMQALAYWTAKQISIVSYAGPFGLAGGLYRAFASKDHFRFPFYQPDVEKFAKDAFPNRRFPLLQGARAALAWHATRFVAYGILGIVVTRLFVESYAVSVVETGRRRDPRLTNFFKELNSKMAAQRGDLPGRPSPVEGVRQQENGHISKDFSGDQDDNDSSPSGGLGQYRDGYQQDEDTPAQNRLPRVGESLATPQWVKDNRTKQDSEEPASFFEHEEDDASPIGGRGVSSDTGSIKVGSAWDRVRMQSNTQSKSKQSSWPTQQSSSSSSSPGEGFFPHAESDRSKTKDEAQKIFDARVEQERQGGSFGSGGGDQKRW